METLKRYYRVDRSQIAYLRFTLEAYDGLAIMTTLNSQSDLIRLTIAPGGEPVVDAIIEDLRRDIMIEPAQPEKNGS